jgi:hypothetical protein
MGQPENSINYCITAPVHPPSITGYGEQPFPCLESLGVMYDDTIIFREAELLIDVMFSRSLVRDCPAPDLRLRLTMD